MTHLDGHVIHHVTGHVTGHVISNALHMPSCHILFHAFSIVFLLVNVVLFYIYFYSNRFFYMILYLSYASNTITCIMHAQHTTTTTQTAHLFFFIFYFVDYWCCFMCGVSHWKLVI